MKKAISTALVLSMTMLHAGVVFAQQAPAPTPAPAGGAAPATPPAAAATPAPPPVMGFFITSVGKGDGGNLGGLAGADAHCQTLAQAVGAGSRQWAAYLSTQAVGGATAVNAKERIGTGPWYNQKLALIATNPNTLHAPGNVNKATALNEKGEMINGRGDATPLMHDIMTGTQKDGMAFAPEADRTCANWTSNVAGAPGGAMMGHHDLQGAPTDNYWQQAHASNGCSEANVRQGGGAGLIYCFARL